MALSRAPKRIWALFICYCGMMLWLLLFQRMDDGLQPWRYNLRLWDTVQRYLWVLRHSLDPVQCRYAAANLFGNVILFIPCGIFLPLLFPKLNCFWRFLLCMFLVISLVELLQLLTGLGSLDVDDLTLNLCGATVGFLGYRLCQMMTKTL